MDRGDWQATYSPWGHRKLDTTEKLTHTHTHTHTHTGAYQRFEVTFIEKSTLLHNYFNEKAEIDESCSKQFHLDYKLMLSPWIKYQSC